MLWLNVGKEARGAVPELVTGFALVAIVLTVAGLASGFVDRAPLSFPIIFLGFGFLLGHQGLGILDVGAENTLLEVVATITLAMVLCLEAVRIGNIGMGGAGFVPILSLGPGTLIIVTVVAGSAYFLFDSSTASAPFSSSRSSQACGSRLRAANSRSRNASPE
jgi:NhaP-type Na+/H+ or K+/H+ antiporter